VWWAQPLSPLLAKYAADMLDSVIHRQELAVCMCLCHSHLHVAFVKCAAAERHLFFLNETTI